MHISKCDSFVWMCKLQFTSETYFYQIWTTLLNWRWMLLSIFKLKDVWKNNNYYWLVCDYCWRPAWRKNYKNDLLGYRSIYIWSITVPSHRFMPSCYFLLGKKNHYYFLNLNNQEQYGEGSRWLYIYGK